MKGLLLSLVTFEIGFVGLCVSAGSSGERRPHFWVRVVLGSLSMPTLLLVMGGALALNALPETMTKLFSPILLLVTVAALVLVRPLLFRGSGPPGHGDGEDGGGPGPDPPPWPPTTPRGGIPLPDADQATARARDHNGPRFPVLDPRRRTREPKRAPLRATSRRSRSSRSDRCTAW